MGVVILGDRVDAQMVQEASQLAGQAETVALRQSSLLASTLKNPSSADVLLMSSWVSQQNEARTLQVKFHDQDYLAACYPLGPEGQQQPPGWMLFLKTTEKLDGLARQQEWITAGLVLAAALAALAMAAPLANRIARPLRDLSQAMAQVGEGDLEAGNGLCPGVRLLLHPFRNVPGDAHGAAHTRRCFDAQADAGARRIVDRARLPEDAHLRRGADRRPQRAAERLDQADLERPGRGRRVHDHRVAFRHTDDGGAAHLHEHPQ